jgi:hypothetical protein
MKLPVRRAHELDECPEEKRWLVEGLWADQAVGVLGGEPKSYKSFLALEMAVSVASGAPCLGRFQVPQPGRVLLFPAEDPLPVVRQRLEAITRAAGADLRTLDIHVITAASVRLDIQAERERLTATVVDLKPKLLVLDPFVRLHRCDENVASEVVPILAYLRHLQRQYGTAVLLVHHAKKGAGRTRAGQALRGSSELHAVGDSNLYLRRRDNLLLLDIEQRAAPSLDGIPVELRANGDTLALRVRDAPVPTAPTASSLAERVMATLAESGRPMTSREIRAVCKARMANVYAALEQLVASGRVAKRGPTYCLLSSEPN